MITSSRVRELEAILPTLLADEAARCQEEINLLRDIHTLMFCSRDWHLTPLMISGEVTLEPYPPEPQKPKPALLLKQFDPERPPHESDKIRPFLPHHESGDYRRLP